MLLYNTEGISATLIGGNKNETSAVQKIDYLEPQSTPAEVLFLLILTNFFNNDSVL